MSPWWSLCTMYVSHVRRSYRRRLGSLLVCACSMCDVHCSNAITSHCLFILYFIVGLSQWWGHIIPMGYFVWNYWQLRPYVWNKNVFMPEIRTTSLCLKQKQRRCAWNENMSLCLKREQRHYVSKENNSCLKQEHRVISAWNELVLVLSSETRSRRTVLLFFVAETTRTSPFFLSSGNKNNVSMSETRTTPLYLKLDRRPSLCYVLIKPKTRPYVRPIWPTL